MSYPLLEGAALGKFHIGMEGMPVPTEGGEHYNIRLCDRSPSGNNLVANLKIFKVSHSPSSIEGVFLTYQENSLAGHDMAPSEPFASPLSSNCRAEPSYRASPR